MTIEPLPAAALYRATPSSALPFRTTDELPDFTSALGQDRAVEALQFGVGMREVGYNLFVLGPAGTGRHTLVKQVLQQRAAAAPTPGDWVYVFNFVHPHRPKAVALPRGRAEQFARDMDAMVAELQAAIPAVFESSEYQTRRHSVEEEFKERQENAFQAVQQEARERGLALVHTPTGLALAPVRDGEVMPPEEFRDLFLSGQGRVALAPGGQGMAMPQGEMAPETPLIRYKVNALVGDGEATGAPVGTSALLVSSDGEADQPRR